MTGWQTQDMNTYVHVNKLRRDPQPRNRKKQKQVHETSTNCLHLQNLNVRPFPQQVIYLRALLRVFRHKLTCIKELHRSVPGTLGGQSYEDENRQSGGSCSQAHGRLQNTSPSRRTDSDSDSDSDTALRIDRLVFPQRFDLACRWGISN